MEAKKKDTEVRGLKDKDSDVKLLTADGEKGGTI